MDKIETDFLWQCALGDHKSYTLDEITPGREDSPTQFLEEEELKFYPVSLKISNNVTTHHDAGIVKVIVREIRDFGVLDTIGGEVWEASIILASYFVLYPNTWSNFNMFLELGCGVGLPSLVLCNLLLAVKDKCHERHIIISDNDVRVLNNMKRSIEDQFFISTSSDSINSHVLKIDWNDFKDENFVPNLPPSSDYIFAFGAALCYSSYHYVLADMINSLIKKYNLKEFTILQISDRVGFSKFLDRLTFFEIAYKLEPIPQECYDYAKHIVKSEKCNSTDNLSTKIYSFPTLPMKINFQDNSNVLLSTPKDSFVLVKCKLL